MGPSWKNKGFINAVDFDKLKEVSIRNVYYIQYRKKDFNSLKVFIRNPYVHLGLEIH